MQRTTNQCNTRSTFYQKTFLARLFRTFVYWPEGAGEGRSISIPPSRKKRKGKKGNSTTTEKTKKDKEGLKNWQTGHLVALSTGEAELKEGASDGSFRSTRVKRKKES